MSKTFFEKFLNWRPVIIEWYLGFTPLRLSTEFKAHGEPLCVIIPILLARTPCDFPKASRQCMAAPERASASLELGPAYSPSGGATRRLCVGGGLSLAGLILPPIFCRNGGRLRSRISSVMSPLVAVVGNLRTLEVLESPKSHPIYINNPGGGKSLVCP